MSNVALLERPHKSVARPAGASAFRPREHRDIERAHIAGERCRAAGGSAVDAALLSIEVGFDAAHRINLRKLMVQRMLRRGPADTDVRLRVGWLAEYAEDRALSIDCALWFLARAQADARSGREQHVRLPGRPDRAFYRGALDELPILLRWLRRHAPHRWNEILDLAATPLGHRPVLQAAE